MAAGVFAVGAGGCAAQEAPAWKNVRAYPADVSMQILTRAMIENVSGLGLEPVEGATCANCHVMTDFASDAIPMKIKAREMMALTLRLNRELAQAAGSAGLGGFRVTCATCHQGSLRPPATPDPPMPGGA